MIYGDTVKGKCKHCECVEFLFMDDRGKHILVRCLCCGWIQLIEKEE